MNDKHTKYTRQTNHYRFSRFSPIKQSIDWFLFCSITWMETIGEKNQMNIQFSGPKKNSIVNIE